jgi:hypothetical protein
MIHETLERRHVYFNESSRRLTTIGSEVLLITTQRKGNSVEPEKRKTEFTEVHRVSQRIAGRRDFPEAEMANYVLIML